MPRNAGSVDISTTSARAAGLVFAIGMALLGLGGIRMFQ
jgi:hypothetical protein